jgi:hypothetical protein
MPLSPSETVQVKVSMAAYEEGSASGVPAREKMTEAPPLVGRQVSTRHRTLTVVM